MSCCSETKLRIIMLTMQLKLVNITNKFLMFVRSSKHSSRIRITTSRSKRKCCSTILTNKDWLFWRSSCERSNTNRFRNLVMLRQIFLSSEAIMKNTIDWSLSTYNPLTAAIINRLGLTKTSTRSVHHSRTCQLKTFRTRINFVRRRNHSSSLLSTCSHSRTNSNISPYLLYPSIKIKWTRTSTTFRT